MELEIKIKIKLSVMKIIRILLLMLVASFAYTSCEDENDNLGETLEFTLTESTLSAPATSASLRLDLENAGDVIEFAWM